MTQNSVYVDAITQSIRKRGYRRHMRECAVGDGRDANGRAFLIFNIESPCWKDRKRWRYVNKHKNHNLRPGNWFEHLFALFGKRPCKACRLRINMMNAAGWWGLWRLLAHKGFWTGLAVDAGPASGCGGCGRVPRVESDKPTEPEHGNKVLGGHSGRGREQRPELVG